MSQRGSDGWNPDAGTGYPYSGAAFVYSPSYMNNDPAQSTQNVPAQSDTRNKIDNIYVFISGTVNPTQSSSWYQSTAAKIVAGTQANVPNQEVAGVFASGINVSGNSIYSTPPNENLSTFQLAGKYQYSIQSGTQAVSGVSNVPYSESSWNH